MRLEARGVTYQYGNGSPRILEDFNFEMEDTEEGGDDGPQRIWEDHHMQTAFRISEAGKGADSSGWKAVAFGRWILSGSDDLAAAGTGRQSQNAHVDVILEGDQVEERVWKELGIEEDWMNRFPAELSGGELQRFCIARALGKGTRFLLADEISTMLDLITQSQIWDFLVKEEGEGRSD